MSETSAEGELAPEDNPVLQGNFAPVHVETTAFELKVTGTLPESLNGTLYRDGPNPIAPGAGHHWFAGDAMVHAIVLEDGAAVAYRNRWIRTESVQRHKGLPAAPTSPNQPGAQGSGSVNVIEHAGRLLALPEVGLPWELGTDADTLGQYDFGGRLSTNMTAHPKIDGRSGELLFFGYDFGPVHLRYHNAAPTGELTRTIEIAKPTATMMHDFAVTATRVVFMDFPVMFDLDMALAGRSIPFRWNDAGPARLGILPRDATTDETRWFPVEPCYVYHPLNAYDDDERIILDVVRHDRTFVEGKLENEGSPPTLERWHIDPDNERLTREVLSDRPQEFPRVDPRVECHPHRFGYSVEFELGRGPGSLLKHDLRTGETLRHDVGENGQASEGVFVPQGPGEDEGYVLSVIYEASTDTSTLRVIAAQDFAGAPVATVALPARVPFGFHGNWVPSR